MTAASAVRAGPVEYRIVRFDIEFSTDDSEPSTNPSERIPDPVLGLGNRDRYASAAFGINADGVVVGMANVDFDGTNPIPGSDQFVSRPFVWQPEPIHAAFGVNTMHPLEWWATGGCEVFAHGAAFDVNSDGDVVGIAMRCDGDSPTPYRAFVWSPDSGLGHSASTMIQLDPFGTTGASETAGAASISNRIPGAGGEPATATAVGWQYEPAPVSGESPYVFDARSLSQTSLDVLPEPVDDYVKGRATGIRPDPTGPEWTAGWLVESNLRQTFCAEEADQIPLRWTGVTATTLPFQNPPPVETINGLGRDVNDAGFVVGYVGDADTSACIQRAAYWPTPAQLELFASNPANASDSTVAIATNGVGAAVGANLDTATAIRWTIPSQYVDLNDVTDCPNCDLIALESAHDINDDGWIVGVAQTLDQNADVTQVGVLLVPLGSCPADVDRDGDVDATDLALVQTATGACPPRAICWRDVNGDCRVDAADVQIVLQYLKTQACATNETLPAPMAAIWMASGGEQFLESDPDAAAVVESAYDPESQITTFVNLLGVIQ